MAGEGDDPYWDRNVFSNIDSDDMFEHSGLNAIHSVCTDLYSDERIPVQATAVMKYWLGGPDPLDYISMYSNPGDPSKGIPPHWHYISFGFSDLHGDGRVHQFTGPGQTSGFGFELTLRLRKEEGETSAPMWPSTLMNCLARYVFQTGNVLDCGDHVPWHRPLDGESDSLIRHMLITEDPQLRPCQSSYGMFQFRQILGVTDDEIRAAQRWTGNGMIKLMSSMHQAAGPFFVTDMKRQASIFDLEPHLSQVVHDSIEKDGSNLGHVTAVCSWDDCSGSVSLLKEADIMMDEADYPVISLDQVHIKFDLQAAELLPLIIKGRLKKDRYFVFRSLENYTIYFIPPVFSGEGVFVNEQNPITAQGSFLQILCYDDLVERMSCALNILHNPKEIEDQLPKEFKFSPPNLTITVYPKGRLD